MQGFLYFDYAKEFPEAIKEIQSLIKQGKLKFRVDIQNGIEQCPKALARLLNGKNEGKVIVRVNGSESAKL